jgi:AraC-like DNA-binding protein
MIVVMRGVLRVDTGGAQVKGGAGDVLFYHAGAVHEERSDSADPAETTFVAFEWTTQDSRPRPVLTHDTQGRIRELIRWLMQEWNAQPGPANMDLCLCFLQTILGEWRRLMSHRESALAGRVRSFLREHIAEDLTLSDLAAAAGMSRFHLVRRYRAETGHTPMEDARRLRVQHARNLILTTDLPLKDIAPRSGLGDAYRLSHLFRRYLDITPRELRANLRR